MTDNNNSADKSPVGKVIVLLIAVFAMFLGAFIYFLSDGELTPEQIAVQQAETAKQLEDLQGKLTFAMENNRKPEELLTQIQLFAEQHPDLVQAQILLGQAYMQSMQAQKAYEAFVKSIQMEPRLYEVEMLAGTIAYDQLNDVPAAMKHYEAAAKLDPASPKPPMFLAQLYVEQKNYDKAIELLHHALELDRDLPWSR